MLLLAAVWLIDPPFPGNLSSVTLAAWAGLLKRGDSGEIRRFCGQLHQMMTT